MNKLIIALFVAATLQSAYTTNSTTGVACGSGASFSTTNCALCDAAGSSATFCQSCNVGYQLSALTAAANGGTATTVTNCALTCAAPCVYCTGSTAGTGKTSTDQRASGNAASTQCQLDNKTPADTLTQANAYCKPTAATSTAAAIYYTPSTVDATGNFYTCYTCSVSNCINCKPATGSAATAAQASCNQCADGFYLDGNSTVTNTAVTPNTNSTQGTACNACGTITPVSGTTSNSAFVVAGTCNKCVNKTGCINATCTRYQGTTAGTGSADTTSYVFDISKQSCVAKSASRVAVAFAAVVGVAFVALF